MGWWLSLLPSMVLLGWLLSSFVDIGVVVGWQLDVGLVVIFAGIGWVEDWKWNG